MWEVLAMREICVVLEKSMKTLLDRKRGYHLYNAVSNIIKHNCFLKLLADEI